MFWALSFLCVACVQLPVGQGSPSNVDDVSLTDSDGDGFFAAADGGEDCDDTRADVNPLIPEVCGDGIDNNCDGTVDDVGEGAVPLYVDDDGDGFGRTDGPVIACEGAPGVEDRVAVSGDCNDADTTVRPGVDDLCDGIDSDCDGAVDEDQAVMRDGERMSSVARAFDGLSAGSPVEIELCTVEEAAVVVRSGIDVTVRGIRGDASSVVILGPSTGQPVFEVRSGGSLTLQHLTVADGRGHAIEASGSSVVEIEDVVLTGHAQPAVRLSSTGSSPVLFSMRQSTISANGSTESLGGGLVAEGHFEVDVVDSVFEANTALDGAGLYAAQSSNRTSTVVLTNTLLVGNEAVARGGGAFVSGADITLSGAAVSANTALDGAGLYLDDVTARGASGATIFGNQASEAGGGVYALRSSLDGLHLSENIAFEGGGAYVTGVAEGSTYTESRVTNTELSANEAVFGAGMFAYDTALVLTSCAFEENVAQQSFPSGKVSIDGQGGAVFLFFGGRVGLSMRSEATSFGVGGLDNEPHDIWNDWNGLTFAQGLNASFVCMWWGCA